ncbi:MAG: hypothetical protein NXI04_24020 [Planctomycetaceae bacterium]|nr:hypothetical protein [Planctomycetaceae bacterium]
MPTSIESPTGSGLTSPEPLPNTVAVIAAVLTGISVALCGLLFYWVALLPAGIEDVAQLESDSPDQLRILILGGSTAVLTLVAWVLCVVGLIMPRRTRFLAAVSGVIASGLLFGLFGVVILGAMLNPTLPPPTVDSPPETVSADEQTPG